MTQYFVHVYHAVRTKISIEADSHEAAMKAAYEFVPDLASENVPFEAERDFQGHGTIHHTESSDEVLSYLVDEVGDEEYHNTAAYDADYSPVRHP